MIVYCCPDLIFATRIRSTAEALGIPCRPARDSAALDSRLRQVDDGKRNDPVTAVVIDLDLGDAGLELLRQTKAHDPNIPVVVYGPHVATELLHNAQESGADFVLPRGTFTAQLPQILERFK